MEPFIVLISLPKNPSNRNNPKPDSGKEIPPEIAFLDPFSFSEYFRNHTKNLFSPDWAFYNTLGIPNEIVFFLPLRVPAYFADPVHNIPPVRPLKDCHISPAERLKNRSNHNAVSSMDEKGRHAVARQCNTNLFPPVR